MAVAADALPPGVEDRVLQIAASNHLLLFGELHGTREVPALVAGLLPKLVERGYRGLALEVPRDQQTLLTAWAAGQLDQPPPFFTRPSRDGRGNLEVLELVKAARGLHMELMCFDQAPDQGAQQWADRDDWMARNLLEAWTHLPADSKVVGICGSLHARLVPDQGLGRMLRKAVSGGQQLWPSLAGWLRRHQPTLRAAAVEVRFARGEYFNMGEKSIFTRPSARTEPWTQDVGPAFTVALWLPRATSATFLAPPT
jgi:erythromycin esterase-like protein